MQGLRQTISTILLLILMGFTSHAEAFQSRGKISGTVTEATTRGPIGGANIIVAGTDFGTATDKNGEFLVQQVPQGTYTVSVSHVGYETVTRTDVVISARRTTQMFVALREIHVEGEAVTVSGSYFERPGDQTTSIYSMGYEDIRRAAGGLGDVNRLIQKMPGVQMTDDQRNDLVVRGGSPAENMTIVDNVEIPNLNHYAAQGTSGGPISMLNTEFIHDATFAAGGFPARYGGRLSSVLDISLREGSGEGLTADLEIGYAGAGLILEGPLTGNGSWMVSGRRSFLDFIVDGFGLTAVPQYSNFQTKLVHRPRTNHKIWLVSIGGVDNIHFSVDPEDTDYPYFLDLESGGWRTITGVNWQMLFGDHGFGVLGISDALGSFEVTGRDTQLDDQLVFFNESVEGETTVKYDLTYRLGRSGSLHAGASGKLFRNYFQIAQPIGFPSPFRLDPGRVHAVFIDESYYSTRGSAYVQMDHSVGRRLDVTGGLRYDYFDLVHASVLSPRFGATYAFRSNLSVNASYGTYYQTPAPVFVHADPLNSNLIPMRSDHYVGGFSYLPVPHVKVTVEGYYKTYSDYPVSAEFPQLSLANMGDNYGVQQLLFPLVSGGTGRSRGIEVYLQKKLTDQLYGQVSYSYTETSHTALDGVSRPGAFDMPHVFSATGGYRLSDHWEVSGSFTYTSGRPYTPFLDGPSREQNREIFDLGRVNAERAPAYSRLDLRVDRRFNFRNWGLTTFFEVQNVFDRENVMRYVWNRKTGEQVAWNQIARFPIGGVNVRF